MRATIRAVSVVAVLVSLAFVLPAQESSLPAGVTVSFTVTRARKIASDQLAVWIENEKGEFVRTLFVTSFVGRRAGWKIRPEATPTWIAVAKVKDTPRRAIDAVSAATPSSGPTSVTWDLRDREGNPVPPGTYRYRIEGNISWANTVLWTGAIRVGDTADSSRATAVYTPPGAEKLGNLVTDVSAQYRPARK